MAGEDSAAGAARAGGLLGSIRGLAATLIAAAGTRLQLFVTELAAEGERVRRIAMLLVCAAILFMLALVLLTLLVVVMFWDDHRLFAIGGLAFMYVFAGVALLLAAWRRAAAGPRPFEATLDELKKDHQRLTQ
jgi:uncharacterized membrane protein YqjE